MVTKVAVGRAAQSFTCWRLGVHALLSMHVAKPRHNANWTAPPTPTACAPRGRAKSWISISLGATCLELTLSGGDSLRNNQTQVELNTVMHACIDVVNSHR